MYTLDEYKEMNQNQLELISRLRATLDETKIILDKVSAERDRYIDQCREMDGALATFKRMLDYMLDQAGA